MFHRLISEINVPHERVAEGLVLAITNLVSSSSEVMGERRSTQDVHADLLLKTTAKNNHIFKVNLICFVCLARTFDEK